MSMTFWVVPDVTDDKKLAVIGASFQPNNAIALAPIDSLTGEPEDQEWLQKEISAGETVITIDQPKKNQILAGRAIKEGENILEKERIKKVKQDFKDLDLDEIKDLNTIKDAFKKIVFLLKELNK